MLTFAYLERDLDLAAGDPERERDPADFSEPAGDLDLSFIGVTDRDLDLAGERDPERERTLLAAGDPEPDFAEPAGDLDLPLDAEPDLDLDLDLYEHFY